MAKPATVTMYRIIGQEALIRGGELESIEFPTEVYDAIADNEDALNAYADLHGSPLDED